MSLTAEMTERHGRALAELADLGMELARGLQEKALAAPTVEAAEGLALAFHRVSRSVRMTLALEARLAREERLGWREARARIDHAAGRRRAQVRAALTREVLSEAEGREAESLLGELEARLGEAMLDDDFTQGAVAAQIERIRADLGLAAQAAANDGGPPERLLPAPRRAASPVAGEGALRSPPPGPGAPLALVPPPRVPPPRVAPRPGGRPPDSNWLG